MAPPQAMRSGFVLSTSKAQGGEALATPTKQACRK